MTNGIPLCLDGLSAGVKRSQAQAFGVRTRASDVHVFPDLHAVMQKYPQMPAFAPRSPPAAAVTVMPSGLAAILSWVCWLLRLSLLGRTDVLHCTVSGTHRPRKAESLSFGSDVLPGVSGFSFYSKHRHLLKEAIQLKSAGAGAW